MNKKVKEKKNLKVKKIKKEDLKKIKGGKAETRSVSVGQRY